jgi:hypothetical protein
MNPQMLLGAQAPPDAQGPPDPQAGPPSDTSPVDALRGVLDALELYQSVEQDDIDLSDAAKAYQIIQGLLARNQKEVEQAGGIGPVHRGMARAMRAQQGQ